MVVQSNSSLAHYGRWHGRCARFALVCGMIFGQLNYLLNQGGLRGQVGHLAGLILDVVCVSYGLFTIVALAAALWFGANHAGRLTQQDIDARINRPQRPE